MDSAELLRLLSEGTRHGLLAALRSGEKSVGNLVVALAVEQSNVSHHLSILRMAGLVTSRRAGRSQLYRLADPQVAPLLDEVGALAARLERVAYTSRLGLPTDPLFHGYG
ncbi:MAG: ArsR/SmtB family transcription factor [Thermoplasmatota archaeon]